MILFCSSPGTDNTSTIEPSFLKYISEKERKHRPANYLLFKLKDLKFYYDFSFTGNNLNMKINDLTAAINIISFFKILFYSTDFIIE